MALELADIFREYGDAYRQKYAVKLLSSHRQAMRAIEQCRTQALGGQLYTCSTCDEVGYSYHSSRRTSGRCAAIVIVRNASMNRLKNDSTCKNDYSCRFPIFS